MSFITAPDADVGASLSPCAIDVEERKSICHLLEDQGLLAGYLLFRIVMISVFLSREHALCRSC